MRTGPGQAGSQIGGSTMMTPSASADSGDAINDDTRTANTIRGRNGIRCMAVSSPGQTSLAAACVGDGARLLQVPVQLGKFCWIFPPGALCNRLLQQGEGEPDLLDQGVQLPFFGLCGFI